MARERRGARRDQTGGEVDADGEDRGSIWGSDIDIYVPG